MNQNYLSYAAHSDIITGHNKRGRLLREICTEANHEPNGRLLAPEILITNMLTGEGRRFVSLGDASRYLQKCNSYLSAAFSVAKKNAGGMLVQSLTIGDFYVTRIDWVRRNEMIPEPVFDGSIQGDGFKMW